MIPGITGGLPAKKPEAKPEPHGKVYITPPPSLDLSEFEDGKEADAVVKLKMDGSRLCVVSINGIPLSQSTEDEEEKSPEEGTKADPDMEMEAEEDQGTQTENEPMSKSKSKKPGDRFMERFRPKKAPVY